MGNSVANSGYAPHVKRLQIRRSVFTTAVGFFGFHAPERTGLPEYAAIRSLLADGKYLRATAYAEQLKLDMPARLRALPSVRERGRSERVGRQLFSFQVPRSPPGASQAGNCGTADLSRRRRAPPPPLSRLPLARA